MRNTGPARFLVPVGVILIVVGIILLGFKTDNYVETTGEIAEVEKLPAVEDEPQQYDVKIKYTVDGKDYETVFSNVSGDYKVKDSIKVYYDPEDPNKTTNTKGGSFIGLIMIVAGAAALVFGVYSAVKAFKQSKALDNAVPGGGKFPSEQFEGFKTAPGVKEIYFRFDGHALKPGYIVEDADRTVLFEGKMTKQALVGARTYEFVNHQKGDTASHEIGHTISQTFNDEFFSAKSWFKFDGKNVWDVIHDLGVRISTNLRSKFPNVIYDIAKNGEPFARVETCSVYVHEEDEAEHALSVPTGSMYYRIWTASDDIDTLFLTVFAISETEQAVVE